MQVRARSALVRAGALVAGSTLAPTASFLGVVGPVTGIDLRLPFYLLVTAPAFVGAILTFEQEAYPGQERLELAVGLGVVTFLLVTLGGEGLAYLIRRPGRVATPASVRRSPPASPVPAWGTGGLNHHDGARSVRTP